MFCFCFYFCLCLFIYNLTLFCFCKFRITKHTYECKRDAFIGRGSDSDAQQNINRDPLVINATWLDETYNITEKAFAAVAEVQRGSKLPNIQTSNQPTNQPTNEPTQQPHSRRQPFGL